MMEWLVKSSMWIMHLFDDATACAYAICGSVIVLLLYLLYLSIRQSALFVRDNGDGTETEYYIGGKRVVGKEENE